MNFLLLANIFLNIKLIRVCNFVGVLLVSVALLTFFIGEQLYL